MALAAINSALNTAISALDKSVSLPPFFVKDSFDVTGRTIMAYHESGKHEAREKFIEEAGTSAFWIGGIPLARIIGGKLAKKFSGINPKIHFKRINSEGIQNYFADEIKDSQYYKFSTSDLKNINLGGTNQKSKLNKIKADLRKKGYIANLEKGSYKKFHIGLTSASVLINLFFLCVGVPKFNQFLSRVIINKEHKKQQKLATMHAEKAAIKKPETVLDTKAASKVALTTDTANKPATIQPQPINQSSKTQPQKTKQIKFGALSDLVKISTLLDFTAMAEAAQLNVTNSMLLLDYGISGSRVTFIPRDNNERVENAVKEGGIIFFFYYAADIIKGLLAKGAKKFFKTPIDLDYKIINDPEFAKLLKANDNNPEFLNFAKYENIDEAVKKLPDTIKNNKEKVEKFKDELSNKNEISIIKFIDEELEKVGQNVTDKTKVFSNFTLQMAQKSGIIDIEKDEEQGKWIRHSEKYIETEKVGDLNNNLKEFIANAKKLNKSVDNIIAKTKKVKGGAVLGNIAICCCCLSFILPSIQYKIREFRTKTKRAPGIKFYQDLAENNELKILKKKSKKGRSVQSTLRPF